MVVVHFRKRVATWVGFGLCVRAGLFGTALGFILMLAPYAGGGRDELFMMPQGEVALRIQNPPALPLRQPSFLTMSAVENENAVAVNGDQQTGALLPPRAAWEGNWVDLLAPGSEILAIARCPRMSTAAEFALQREPLARLIDTARGPEPKPDQEPTAPSDGLEPISSAVQVAATVGSAAQQEWLGFGVGGNGHASAKAAEGALAHHAHRVFEELNTKVLRLWTPENTSDFLDAYKKTWKVAKAHGVDVVLATGFIWRGNISPEEFADGVAASSAGGIPITHVGLQNEPDGHPDNAVPAGEIVDAYRRVRARLNALGLQHVKIIGFEWAHFAHAAEREFDLLNAAGLIPGTVVAGAGHCYSNCPRPSIYRDRWATRGVPVWATETGNAGMPSAIARSINSLNHGAAVEIFHIGLVSKVDPPPDGDTAKQALVYGDGRRAPWHGQYATVFKNLPRGTVMRPVTSSDRPSGMDPLYAEHMIRSPGKNPRLQVASGKRPDGKWYLAAVNTTQGRGINASHVGACFPAATLQVTTQIVELAARDGMFRSTRHNASGIVVPSREYPMRDGLVRFTLAPGELIVMVGG